MRRRAKGEKVERLRLDRLNDLGELRPKIARWAADHLEELRQLDPEVPDELHDRASDNWRPLLAIAKAAGGHWPKTAREAAKLLNGGEAGEDQTVREQLLTDIRAAFDERGVNRLFSEVLLGDLHKLEDRPWPEWGRERKKMTKTALAGQLKHFAIRPQQMRIGETSKRGYESAWFFDAWSRYCPVPKKDEDEDTPPGTPPPRPETPKQLNNDGDSERSDKQNSDTECFGSETAESPIIPGTVSDVSVAPGEPATDSEWEEL